MSRSRIKHTATAIVACASVAAVVGIATGAAAPSNGSSSSNGRDGPPTWFAGPGGPPPGGIVTTRAYGANGNGARIAFRGPPGGPGFAEAGPAVPFGGPPVHSEMVMPNKAGDGFITVTQDNGKVNSVSGSQLTITEGTEKATYKTVTIDVPGDATVIRDGQKAALSDIQQGDQVHISQSPQGSFVFATDSQFQNRMLKQFRQHMKEMPRPPAGMPGMPGLPPEPMAGRSRH